MKVTKTRLSKILRNCIWNPRDPGPMRPIVDVGGTEYYARRAIECINRGQYEMAIKLLALAEASLDG